MADDFDVFQMEESALACFGAQAQWDAQVASLASPDAWLSFGNEFQLLEPQPAPSAPPGDGAGAAGPPAAAHARPANAAALGTLSVFRCLDVSHPQPCPFCMPAPTEEELDDFELVGEARRAGVSTTQDARSLGSPLRRHSKASATARRSCAA